MSGHHSKFLECVRQGREYIFRPMTRGRFACLIAALLLCFPAAPYAEPLSPNRATLTLIFPELGRFVPTRIKIESKWTGFSEFSPMIAKFDLSLEAGQFKGKGQVSVPRIVNSGTAATVETATVEPDTVARFLHSALHVGLEEKPYQPRIVISDTYPSFEIEFQGGYSRPLRVWSQSQGWTPWGFGFAGRSFVADTKELGEALSSLEKQVGWNQAWAPTDR